MYARLHVYFLRIHFILQCDIQCISLSKKNKSFHVCDVCAYKIMAFPIFCSIFYCPVAASTPPLPPRPPRKKAKTTHTKTTTKKHTIKYHHQNLMFWLYTGCSGFIRGMLKNASTWRYSLWTYQCDINLVYGKQCINLCGFQLVNSHLIFLFSFLILYISIERPVL